MQVYAIAGDVIRRPLDTEVAVFLSDRCQTHLLDDAGGQVLQALLHLATQGGPVGIDQLSAHLLGDDQPPPSDAAQALGPLDVAETGTQGWQRHQHACDALRPVLAALVNIGVLTVSPC